MTDDVAPQQERKSDKNGTSGFRSNTPVKVDSRLTGGSGVQRSHLRDRKSWLKSRTRGGQSWAQRKASSLTYCAAKTTR
jgi:hypothetical protein